MAAYEYKITFQYDKPLLWTIAIWQREVLPHDSRAAWTCILLHDAPTLEGHLDQVTRLKQVLRTLSA